MKPPLSDFELLNQYENSLQSAFDLMVQYIYEPSDKMLEVSVSGCPTRMSAIEVKTYLRSQMLFFVKKIDEYRDKIIKRNSKNT